MSLLNLPIRLSANPHYYDYSHILSMEVGNICAMIDGEGQHVNLLIDGRFSLEMVSDTEAYITFAGLTIQDSAAEELVAHLPDFTVHVTKESGVFAFHQEVVWRIADPDERPCLLYHTRYAFWPDPLAYVEDIAFDMLEEIPDPMPVYFYAEADKRSLSLKSLRDLGITPQEN